MALAAAALLALSFVPIAVGEQASAEPRGIQAGYLDLGDEHTCTVLGDRTVRCWGRGLAGRLGYGDEANVLSGAAARPVDLGPGRSARAVSAGDFHTCAILDDASVRCWGFGANGRLGYAATADVRSPAGAPAVDIGAGRTARAITTGASHTCAIRDDGQVVCWGNGISGRLGYGNQSSIGDNEAPGSAGVVAIGPGRTAVAISAGDFHTCVIRDDGSLLCWGFGSGGQLGYGGTSDVGDDETPAQAGPVDLGGRRARAVSGGKGHTCVVLDDGSARCWGFGADGRLGYASQADIYDADDAGPIDLGAGRTAVAIAAGEAHTCAILDTGAVRCWGFGGNGRLGYGDTLSIGNDGGETPGTAGPVPLGPGRTARALSVGFSHTCAALDDGTLRCWGFGGGGRLGYGDESSVGDTPARSVAAVGPVPMGGTVPPTIADLSLAMGASAGRVGVGAGAQVSVTVGNAGVDTATGVAVAVSAPPGLPVASAAASQGAFAGATWQVGSLAPGASATLVLGVSPAVAATHVLPAEVAASGVFDPDSTPANGAPGEDDRGAVAIVASEVNGAGPVARPAPRRLAIRATRIPRRGVAKRIRVTGALALPAVRPAPRCRGRVRVRATAGRRAVAARTVALRRRSGACRFAVLLTPRRTGGVFRVAVSARFLGTSEVAPKGSRSVRVSIRPDRRPRPRALAAAAAAVPRRGVTRVVTVTGTLRPPATLARFRCTGRVQARVRVGGRTTAATARLRARGGSCRYAARVRPAATGRAVVTARFLGTAQLKPRTSRARVVRVR